MKPLADGRTIEPRTRRHRHFKHFNQHQTWLPCR
jgi:hypothetical protein